MTPEQLYRDLKSLKAYPEWLSFVERIKEIAAAHKESSVFFTKKGNALDGQRQAWIAEGLMEAIEDPDAVVKTYEYSKKGVFQKACQLCGTIFDKVKM